MNRYLDMLRALDVADNFSETAVQGSAKSVKTTQAPNLSVSGVGLPALSAAAGDDWDAVKDDPKAVAALATALQISAMRSEGIAPKGYNQSSLCAACGPVLLWPGAPAHVEGCPWCFNRVAGKPIPRPPVTCGSCLHFTPSTHATSSGVGQCAVQAPASGDPYARRPLVEHVCVDWRPGHEG